MCYQRLKNKKNIHEGRSISVATWNINGMISKKGDKSLENDFKDMIVQHDIVGIIESHTGEDYNLEIEGFCTKVSNNRTVCKRNNKYYGGLILCIRDGIKKGIEVMKSEDTESIWIRLDKLYFGMENDIFIGFAYVIPSNSTYTKKIDFDPMENIEKQVIKYSSKGKVVVMGDLNGRTADLSDYITRDEEIGDDNDNWYEIDCMETNRSNQDKHVNAQGSRLLEMCVGNRLRILNGRTLGDLGGCLTCHRPGGSSVVDYAIVNEDLLNRIYLFQVHDFLGHLSDHCMISCVIQCQITDNKNQHVVEKDRHVNETVIKYVWNEESRNEYEREMQSRETLEKLENLRRMTKEDQNVENAIVYLNNILCEVADKSLRKVSRKKKQKKRKHYKKWYDGECESIRKQIKSISIKVHKDPFNRNTRTEFFRQKKLYKKLIKTKKAIFQQTCVNKLESLAEKKPNEYWKLLNDLKEDQYVNKVPTNQINLEEWQNYFMELHDDKTSQDEVIDTHLHSAEAQKSFTKLDYRIKESEVKKAIQKLKCKKAAGYDSILAEMVKAGQTQLTPILTKIF